MRGSKVIARTSEQMRAARRRGGAAGAERNQQIGETIVRRRGRPVVGEPKTAVSLRIPNSIWFVRFTTMQVAL